MNSIVRNLLLVLGVIGVRLAVLADADVYINEFMAANGKTLKDSNGDYSDWIEIYNAGPDSVNLGGWTLTDTPNNLTKWAFPSTNLAANSYLVVFASGKNRAVTGAELHTNFALDADGEYLALVDAEGNVVSEFAPAYPQQFVDVSYGWRMGRMYYFPQPTPRAANIGGYNSFVADPMFSHERGFYTNAFDLVLTTATADATIVFTTNGSVPSLTATSTNGLVYTGPIRIDRTIVVRAAGFKQGYQPSNVCTHSYLFVDDIVNQSPTGLAPWPGWPNKGTMSTGQIMDYGMDPDIVNHPKYRDTIKGDLLTIPSFSVVMDLNDLFSTSTGIYANPGQDGRAWERKCSLELIYPDGHKGFQINCGIRIRGGYSRSGNNPKHAFRLFFREVYGAPKLEYPLFGDSGAERFDCFDLRTAQNYSWSFEGDSRCTHLRDQFSRDTQLDMGHQGERGGFYHLYINGQYWGLYNTCERPEASYGASYFGGRKEDYDVIKVSPDNGYTIGATDGNMTNWTRLYNICKAGLTNNATYEMILGNNPDGTRNPSYPRLIELDNLIDYMLVILYTGNLDAPISNFLGNEKPNNFYAVRNRLGNDGFRFVAHDSEHTLLNVNESRIGPYSAGNTSVNYSNPQWIWQKMWTNTEFAVVMADRVHKHFFNGGALTPEACTARLMRRKNEIDRAIVGESARWGDSKRATPLTRDDWLAAVNTILNSFIPGRTQVVLNQLRSKNLYPSVVAPSFNKHGGTVNKGFTLNITAPSGTIYYTLDGSDPRLRGGAVSPTAIPYTGPVVINESTLVKSRVLSGTLWSALNEAEFIVIQTYSNLLITEIMYHPPDEGDIDGDAFEFIELKNANPFGIDISGVRFVSGIKYEFPRGTRLGPGEFVVLVADPAAFALKYPGVRIGGVYEGRLANGGERVTIVHAAGAPLFSVEYKDKPPWPAAADGIGFSIVSCAQNSNPDPDDPLNWRASTRIGGSPGADDPPTAVPPVVINECLTHSEPPDLDAIELYNPTSETVDVSWWFITDDFRDPKKFQIPAGTTIAPYGYLVFTEKDFNPTPGIAPSFSLNATGDQVYLFSATQDGALTGYSDGFVFGAAQNGVTFGRYTNAVGEVHFPPQVRPTLGFQNAGPRVGPVVINEIHYRPLPGYVEFLELKNITRETINLYDPQIPTNTWRINGIGFTFPTNIAIGPRGLLVVAATDPVTFRKLYPVPESVPVFGPFEGTLQDNGELIELQSPDEPHISQDGSEIVPYVTIDLVRYSDKAPWPEDAAGKGPSLERINPSAYGNDPLNWRASFGPPSPGLENDGNRAPIVSAGVDAEISAASFPQTIQISGTVTDDGLPLPPGKLDINWRLVTGPGHVLFASANSPTTTVQLPGTGIYVLELSAFDGQFRTSDQVVITVSKLSGPTTFLSAGSKWRYLDDGSDQGTNWVSPEFPDVSWKVGNAQFGYSVGSPENDEVTMLQYGPDPNNKYITYYFRTTFIVPDPKSVTSLTARLLRDDGAVVWLNGREAYRDNMPEGPITYKTLATTAVGGADESTFFERAIDPSYLIPGTNVLAIEIHQSAPSSTDLSFDFQLDATVFPKDVPPMVDAGPDLTNTLGQVILLQGAVSDDGLPSPPGVLSVRWEKTAGPGEVTFLDPFVWVTGVRFSTPGDYVLKLTADDGASVVSDVVTVRVLPGTFPQPKIQSLVVAGDLEPIIIFEFNAAAGWHYTVQYCDSLTQNEWHLLAHFPAQSQPRSITVSDPVQPNRSCRFYRIVQY